jgi:hypothetical protein
MGHLFKTARARKVLPEVETWKKAHEEYQTMINGLNIDALTYGSVVYDPKILQITPNYPYNYEKARIQLRGKYYKFVIHMYINQTL